MNDQERKPSRRERRAQEQREAQRLDDTAPLEPGLDTEGFPTHSPDGRPLSRKERRRIDRVTHPVETWTAEEEMIATGQIPAMTPERIAEQETLARRKAEEAQREALTASEELAQLARPTQAAPAATPSPAEEAPRRETLIPESHDHTAQNQTTQDHTVQDQVTAAPSPTQPAAPSEGWPVPAASSQPETQASPPSTEVSQPNTVASQPGTGAQSPWSVAQPPSSRSASQAPVSESPVPQAPAPAEPERPLGMPAGMTPQMFDMLFPPGSAQRTLMEKEAAESGADASHTSAVSPPSGSAPSAPRTSVSASAPGPSAASTAAPAQSAPSVSAPESRSGAEFPAAEEPAHQWGAGGYTAPFAASAPGATSPDEPSLAPWVPANQDEHGDSATPQWSFASDDAHDVPHRGVNEDAAVTPNFDTFAEEDTDADAAVDPAGYVASDDSAVFPGSASGTPASTSAPADSASQWDSHPLMTAQTPAAAGDLDVDEDEVDSKQLPRPDLSRVSTSTFSPTTMVEPVPTGNFQIPEREKPDLHPAGGRHHFGWAQLAVMGAVAFVLGVIVWNVMKGS
ncbi:hypothetical protein [Demequina sediminicola]|uniref:hypothetical protein n=1 Tax=Demequina sediminicola TaxID=1095026 RepID=UPI0007850985|nr:hypothetical protein [Demequina sediminicola]